MTATRQTWQLVGIGAALHFIVDCLCLCTLYLLSAHYTAFDLVGAFIVYNFFAFVTQIATGRVADIARHPHMMLLAALMLLIIGVGTMGLTLHCAPHSTATELLPTATLLGLGNSLFHTWGGKQVAVNTHNDMRALGVFVSTGAFGLSVGYVLCSWALLYILLISACVLAALYLMTDIPRSPEKTESPERPERPRFIWWVMTLAMVVLMLLVMLRSWIGESFSATVPKSGLTMLAVGALAMLGKMSGGWLARGMGIVRSMVVVLVVVLTCLLCSDTHLAVALAGLFAINCTMPVTLYLANEVLRGHEGLAFGLLAAALIPGYLLTLL